MVNPKPENIAAQFAMLRNMNVLYKILPLLDQSYEINLIHIVQNCGAGIPACPT